MTIREEPPPIPPCPRCQSRTAEWDEGAHEASGRGWFCPPPCKNVYTGTATEATKHARWRIADQAWRESPDQRPEFMRGEP